MGRSTYANVAIAMIKAVVNEEVVECNGHPMEEEEVLKLAVSYLMRVIDQGPLYAEYSLL